MIRHNWTITQRTIKNNTVKEITRTHRINKNKGSAKTAHIGPARTNTFMNKYNMHRTVRTSTHSLSRLLRLNKNKQSRTAHAEPAQINGLKLTRTHREPNPQKRTRITH